MAALQGCGAARMQRLPPQAPLPAQQKAQQPHSLRALVACVDLQVDSQGKGTEGNGTGRCVGASLPLLPLLPPPPLLLLPPPPLLLPPLLLQPAGAQPWWVASAPMSAARPRPTALQISYLTYAYAAGECCLTQLACAALLRCRNRKRNQPGLLVLGTQQNHLSTPSLFFLSYSLCSDGE